MSEKSLTQRSARGGANALAGQLAKIILGLVSLSVLARIIGPDDYGLMAMAIAVTSLAEVFKDFGLSTATIQAKTLSEQERTNLWWTNSAIGALICLILVTLSPFIAWFYQDDRLLPIMMVMSLNFLISGMSTQYFAHLQRDIQFGKIAVNNIVSNLLGLLVAVFIALAGHGVWALVAQGLTISLSSLLFYIGQTRWFPGFYHRGVSVKSFVGFGLPLMFSNLLNHLAIVLDTFLIGRFTTAETLGYFNRAQQAVRTPLNSLRSPLNNVAFSALSKKQSDKKKLAEVAEKGQIVLAYPLALMGGGFAAAASPLVLLFLGPQWEGAVPFFTWLAIAEALNCLAMTAGWIFLSTGHTQSILKLTILSTLNRILFVVVGGLLFGAVGVAAGQALAFVLQWPLSLLWTEKVTGVSTRGLLRNSYRIFFVVLFSSLVTYSVGQYMSINLLVDLILLVAIQLVAALSCALFPGVRKDYQTLIQIASRIRK